MNPRSWLFCPGDRTDRLAKAAASADRVVADLEDAVSPESKGAARNAARNWLRANQEAAAQVWVRVNNDETNLHADLAALRDVACAGIVLPKAELDLVRTLVGAEHPILALVETATGLWDLRDIARTPGVYTVTLGEYDLAAELGAASPDQDTAPLSWARSSVIAATVAAGSASPPAPVSARLADPAGFTEDTDALLRYGFFGRMCIHPKQVELTHERMRPTAHQVAEARKTVAAAKTAEREGHGVIVVEGRMVDAPIVRRANAVLELATASGVD